MKNLAISFGLSLAIICAVITFNKINANNPSQTDDTTIAKTFVETDSLGRVTLELTMQLKDNVWVEHTKQVMKYTSDKVEKSLYLFENKGWVRLSSQVVAISESENDMNDNASQNHSPERILLSLSNDLSFDEPDILHDIAFDKDGNLILNAVYEWDNNTKSKGITMFEYNYSNGELSRTTTYAWNSNKWQKTKVSDLHYISTRN